MSPPPLATLDLAHLASSPRSDIEIALLLPAYGAIVGSMVGVIPEGLDWEEPWQVREFWQSKHVKLLRPPSPCRNGRFLACWVRSWAGRLDSSLLWGCVVYCGSLERAARRGYPEAN